jgi:hypothetical protein
MKNDDDEPKTVSPGDAADFGDLWLDPALGDGIVDVRPHNVPIGKPKDFFRVVPDSAYRRRTEAITIKPEGVIDEQHYIVAKPMRGRIEEARPCTLVTCIYRDGSLRLWPIALPKDGERDNEAWMSARAAAKIGMERWVKIVWVRRAYQTREAQPGYAPEPDYSKLPAFDDLVGLAYGATGVIRDTKHPVYRDLMGSAPVAGDADDDADL